MPIEPVTRIYTIKNGPSTSRVVERLFMPDFDKVKLEEAAAINRRPVIWQINLIPLEIKKVKRSAPPPVRWYGRAVVEIDGAVAMDKKSVFNTPVQGRTQWEASDRTI